VSVNRTQFQFSEEDFMATKVKPIPDGYHNVTPYLVIKGAAAAIDFYKKAFGAVEVMRMPQPDGRIGHAELKFGDSHVMLADEFPEMDVVSPKRLGNSPVGLLLYVDDVDKTVERAVALGATIKKPVANQFYGDRNGTIEDPFGHKWTVAVHVEDVTPEEMERRMAAVKK
jgi:PhnB protein